MREAFEAVAEFLAHHGGLDEYDAVVKTMQHKGWSLDEDHDARWRAVFAVLRAELSDEKQSINYVFIFERLLQLYVRIPQPMCREIFASELVFHIIVERFATAYANYDAEVFKLESDLLCHTEEIYAMCSVVRDKLYDGDESSPLGKFLRAFLDLFDQAEPKAAWEDFRERHRLPESVFLRDMKRVLWRIEDQVFGLTQIEQTFGSEDDKPTEKRVIVPRRILENAFSGSSSEWNELATVVTVKGLTTETPDQVERRRESLPGGRIPLQQQGQGMNDVVGETPPEQEERVWSTKLPIEASADSEASGEEDTKAAIDEVVRREKPTQKSPGIAKKSQQRTSDRPRTSSDDRTHEPEPAPVPAQPKQRSATTKRARDDEVEEIDDDAGDLTHNDDDDDFLDVEREIPVEPKRRKTRKFWSDKEVAALVKGVKKYGGQWLAIKQAYKDELRNRSNVDIKDKYRNLVKANRIPPIRHDD